MADLPRPPELVVDYWLNTESSLSLEALRGKVVVIFVFQMLCPGCVKNSLPQAKIAHAVFNPDDVVILGLHSVFEHHQAYSKAILSAFLQENRIHFPVAIDKPSDSPSRYPETMKAYQMQGTPTLIVIDRKGLLRKQKFGHENDMVLGAELMKLVEEVGE